MRQRQPNRRPEPGSNTMGWIAALGALLLLGGAVFAVWAAAALTAVLHGLPAPGNPFTYPLLLAAGQSTWPPGATAALLVLLVLGCAVAGLLGWSMWRIQGRRTRVDSRSSSMATSADLAPMTGAGARQDAARLGAEAAGPGVPVGNAVGNNRPLLGSWEWVQVHIMGPRAGKTTCICVRQLLETAGPALFTSNKRDAVDMTRGPRSELGAVWVQDLQQIIGEPATWWWDPLSYVVGIPEADEMAGLFAASSREPGSRPDAYFDPAAKTLLSGLLLAAASAHRPITAVYGWLTTPEDVEPVSLLRVAGYDLPAEAVYGVLRLTPKQRDGVVGSALQMCAFLRNEQVLPWVTPTGPADDRPQFDPAAFVRSRQTIYLISREGKGSARALTAALTVAIVTAAESLAAGSPGGRLQVPLTCVLDEAANVCRWPDLPDLYSHYGSRGIVMSTFLQGWSQGLEAWGRDGMEKLWTAANIRVVGAGVAETDFLERVSKLIGEHDVVSRSTSSSQGRRTVSSQLRRERIFDVADLAAMPRGRAVMFASGQPAALVKLVHWSQTDYADKIRASDAHYGVAAPLPAPEPLLA